MADATPRPRRRASVNTLIFSAATGLSRIAGLIREVVASSYFGTGGPISAFTLAFQIPNLVRSLFADAALSAAFVPVFTELLEEDRRKDAFHLAAAMFGLILVVLGALTALFTLAAPQIMPLFTGEEFTPELDALTVGLAQVLFPIVILLGLNGLVVGVLNAYDHFSVPALSPLVWNVVIIGALVGLSPRFEGPDQTYAYAIGVLAGTAVQFAMAIPVLRRIGFPLAISARWGDPRIRQVLTLMLPVTIGLGLINFNLVINSALGTKVSEQAPRAIDAAFRIYMLPQGMFSVAVATVLFPALSRLAARGDLDGLRATQANGLRQIGLLLIPAAAATAVLAEPITRLVYERGAFGADSTDLVAQALLAFAFSLPFSGMNLLLTRTFFSLQRPWSPTKLAGGTLALNVAVSLALYRPLGVAGIVIGTVVSSAAMTIGQAVVLRRSIGGMDGGATVRALALQTGAALGLAAVTRATWQLLDEGLGRSLPGQAISVTVALALGTAVYAGILLSLRQPEARQILDLFSSRLRRARP